MRTVRKAQLDLFFQWPKHKLGQELQKISQILARHPEFDEWVYVDLAKDKEMTGDVGMTAEQVLRAATIKSVRGLSFRELSFNVADSSSTRAFMMLETDEFFSSSCLQKNISKISEETWSEISKTLVLDAKELGIEDCKTVRVDSTVTSANIHHPTDSSLLYDCIRLADREFKKARSLLRKDHWRLTTAAQVKDAKSLRYRINNAKNDGERLPLYKKLLKLSKGLKKGLPQMIRKIDKACSKKGHLIGPLEQLKNIDDYLGKIINQTEKRVIKNQKVPANRKIVSIFEPHTDIIVKDRRETQFGHKLFLTSGKSNMILHCDIPRGNPSDADKFLDTLDSLDQDYSVYPRKISADGGFASQDNVIIAKLSGAKDVCFPKRCNMKITEMVKSSWVYQNLLKWRAGIEAVISFLKRCFGLGLANWKGFDGFKRYVRGSVAAYNFVVLARHEIERS